MAAKFKADFKRWLTLDHSPLELEQVREFLEECKKTVMKYHRQCFEADKKFGLFINCDKAYWTHPETYIEREWHYLERAWRPKTGKEYNTFGKMQNVTDMKFDNPEDEGCSRK